MSIADNDKEEELHPIAVLSEKAPEKSSSRTPAPHNLSLFALATLAACGGGGGSDVGSPALGTTNPGTNSNIPTSQPVPNQPTPAAPNQPPPQTSPQTPTQTPPQTPTQAPAADTSEKAARFLQQAQFSKDNNRIVINYT